MSYICKLVCGTRTLNLNDSTYSLAIDFVPPPIVQTISYAMGTSANRMGGGTRTGDSLHDRDWSFGVNITGASAGAVKWAANQLRDFLSLAGGPEKLYLEYREFGDYTYYPLWGTYGAPLRYEVKAGSIAPSGEYAIAKTRNTYLPECPVTLTVAPVAEGNMMRVGSALGGILEDDVVGCLNKVSRGVIIPQETTNEFTNPIFEHATYDTNWAVSNALLLKTKNLLRDYYLFGHASMKLVNTESVSYRVAYELINTADTNQHTISCYVKLPDGGAVSVTQCQLYYDAPVDTLYAAKGNGWYRLWAGVTGINAATVAGIAVNGGRTIYVDGFQFEQTTLYPTPLCYGSMLGCAPTGVLNESSTYRTAARLRFVGDTSNFNSFSSGQGTIMVVWKPEVIPYNVYFRIFETTGSTLSLIWDYVNTRWYLTDSTNTGTSSTTSIPSNIPIIFHIVYGCSTFFLYINGVKVINGTAFTPKAIPAYMYLGSDDVGARQSDGTYMGFGYYDRMMSATEVLADYNNIHAIATAGDGYGQCVSKIPWLWTKDGDEIFDAYTDATHSDWGVAGGIPGSLEAKTLWVLYNATGNRAMLLNVNPHAYFTSPSNTIAKQGAAFGTPANVPVDSTPPVTITELPFLIDRDQDAYRNKEFAAYMVLRDAGANLTIAPSLYMNDEVLSIGNYLPITTDATIRQYLTDRMTIPEDFLMEALTRSESSIEFHVFAVRTVAGNANVGADFYRVLVGKWVYLATNNAESHYVVLNQRHAFACHTLTTDIETLPFNGSVMDLEPNKYNHIILLTGAKGSANSLTETATITAIVVTPRYALL